MTGGGETITFSRNSLGQLESATSSVHGTVQYQYDALGRRVSMTDAGRTTSSSGAVQASYSYTPFGRSDQAWQPGENRFRFASGEVDRLGLYSFRARYYSPERTRFISEDPIGLAGGVNPYVYARNDPVNPANPTRLVQEVTPVVGPVRYTEMWFHSRNPGAGWLSGDVWEANNEPYDPVPSPRGGTAMNDRISQGGFG